MKRLTRYSTLLNQYVRDYSNYTRYPSVIDKLVQKVGKIEDYEDKLGIECITILLALEFGVYYEDESGTDCYFGGFQKERQHIIVDYKNKCLILIREPQDYSGDNWIDVATLHFKDYGKTWGCNCEL